MRMLSRWRHGLRPLLLVLTLISPYYLHGQEGSKDPRTVVRKLQPQYPTLAQRMSIKGSVKLELLVELDRRMKSMSAKGGHPLLVEAAQDAIRQWK